MPSGPPGHAGLGRDPAAPGAVAGFGVHEIGRGVCLAAAPSRSTASVVRPPAAIRRAGCRSSRSWRSCASRLNRRDRPGVQPADRDRLARLLAETVFVVFDPLQRGIDLGDQLALPVPGSAAPAERSVSAEARSANVRLLQTAFLQAGQRLGGFAEQLGPPGQKLAPEVLLHDGVQMKLFVFRRLYSGGTSV